MPRIPKARACIVCGKDLGFYTRRKYCDEHLRQRVVEITEQLHYKRGPIWRKYKKAWLRAMRKLVR